MESLFTKKFSSLDEAHRACDQVARNEGFALAIRTNKPNATEPRYVGHTFAALKVERLLLPMTIMGFTMTRRPLGFPEPLQLLCFYRQVIVLL